MEAVAQLGRVVISLAFVLLLMWGLARFIKRSPRTRDGKLLDVLARTQLSRNSSIAVVRVLDQALIVGITDGQVSLIGETDLLAAEQQLEQQTPARKRGSLSAAARPATTGARSTARPTARPTAGSATGSASAARPTSRATSHRPAAATTDSTPQVTIPADIPGADLLAKATGHGTPTTATKQGSVGGPKTAQEAKSSPLSGSALSPATWRQTVESLRDLTVRTR